MGSKDRDPSRTPFFPHFPHLPHAKTPPGMAVNYIDTLMLTNRPDVGDFLPILRKSRTSSIGLKIEQLSMSWLFHCRIYR